MFKTLATFIVPYLGPRTAIFMAMNTLISDLRQLAVFKESFITSDELRVITCVILFVGLLIPMGFKVRLDSLHARFIACMQLIPQVHV